VCTVIGVPVSTWVCPTARRIRSTSGVSECSSIAHLSSPAFTPVPAMPSRMSFTNSSTIGSGTSKTQPGPVKRHWIGAS
jgi:hypothetical protein